MASKVAANVEPDGRPACLFCKGAGGFRQRFQLIYPLDHEQLITGVQDGLFHPVCVGPWLTSNEGLGIGLQFYPGELR